MANDTENSQRPQLMTGGAEDPGTGRKEQFNELSELSLEERMAVADRMGIPVFNEPDAAKEGAMSGFDGTKEEFDNRMEEDNTEARPNQ